MVATATLFLCWNGAQRSSTESAKRFLHMLDAVSLRCSSTEKQQNSFADRGSFGEAARPFVLRKGRRGPIKTSYYELKVRISLHSRPSRLPGVLIASRWLALTWSLVQSGAYARYEVPLSSRGIHTFGVSNGIPNRHSSCVPSMRSLPAAPVAHLLPDQGWHWQFAYPPAPPIPGSTPFRVRIVRHSGRDWTFYGHIRS